MTTPDTPSISRDEERQLATDLFNHVWELLETPSRTADQDERMIHAAHASRFHWGNVGSPENLAVGDWQCSRVYSVLERAEPALYHARRCLERCEETGLEGFHPAEAFEALARAHLVAGEPGEAFRFERLARGEAEKIEDAGEREILERDLPTLPR